ncbi:uncharacterized protein C8orf88 homolog [Pholidichthys leucotaenia]
MEVSRRVFQKHLEPARPLRRCIHVEIEKISYTRDFLISLAHCPAAKKKPEFLPDHPIVLTVARDPGNLKLCGKVGSG